MREATFGHDVRSGTGVFHEGERAVQRRAGVDAKAARLGPRMIQETLSEDFASFLGGRPFVVVGSVDADGRAWASLLYGPPGFVATPTPGTVRIAALPAEADPLLLALRAGPAPLGMLAIEPASRSRIRVNGTAVLSPQGIVLSVQEVFGNCPKYIHRRAPVALLNGGRSGTEVRRAEVLDAAALALVRAADTFFVATRHPVRGADASHRGGPPGFVAADEDGRRLTFPDYQGNNMFQSLGNLSVDDAVGLLFVDWDTGSTLQLSGRGTVVWDAQRIAAWPGAQRLVDVEIEQVIEHEAAFPVRWEPVEA